MLIIVGDYLQLGQGILRSNHRFLHNIRNVMLPDFILTFWVIKVSNKVSTVQNFEEEMAKKTVRGIVMVYFSY